MPIKLLHELGLTNLSKEQVEKFSALLISKGNNEEIIQRKIKINVVGLGGGGCNAVDSMLHRGLENVDFISINTDAQVLINSNSNKKIQIGRELTRGLGAGADPQIGRKAAEESKQQIAEALIESDMIFLVAGMGGGTGTGAAPVIANIARKMGILTIGIVTKPFRWEGKTRMFNALSGIKLLKEEVDSLIVIPNEKLLNILDKSTNAFAAFDKPNEYLYEATRSITDIITTNGLINIDFADVKSVMKSSGLAVMGYGIATGNNRAIEAAQKSISCPLIENQYIKGAKSIIVNVTGSNNMSMQEVNEGNNVIFDSISDSANIIFGVVNREEMKEQISYTFIATGFEDKDLISGNVQFDSSNSISPTNLENDSLEVPTILQVGRSSRILDLDNEDPNSIRQKNQISDKKNK